MLTLRRHITLLATAMLLSSCIYDEMQEGGQPVPATPEEQETPQPQTIQLSATLVGARTRADDGTNDGNFALETPITVSVDGTNYNYKTDATSISNPMVCQDATPPYFPVNGSSVRIVAFYPSTVSYSTTAQTFTVAHDQSQTATGTDNYKASDLMVGLPKADFVDDATPTPNSLIDGTGYTRKVKPTSKQIPLEFEHKMVKIRLHTTNNGATVKKVEMKGIKRSIEFNPSDFTFTNLALATDDTDAAANTVIMYDNSSGSAADVTCTALIPKQDLAATTEFITVTTQSGVPLVYKLPEAYYFGPGKQYFFNVNINDYEITVTSSVYDWDDAVEGTDFTHGDGLAMTKSIKMNPLWYVAEGNMTNAVNATTLTMGGTNEGRFYSFTDALSTFTDQNSGYDTYQYGGKIISGQDGTWHLPVHTEWLGIVPVEDPSDLFDIDTNNGGTPVTGPTVKFGYNADTKVNGEIDKSYWWKKSATVLRAIRFIGTNYCSAWLYERLGGWSQSNYGYYRISATLIDDVYDISDASAAISDEKWSTYTFGNDDSKYAVQRVFYARGYNNSGTSTSANYVIGTHCGYRSATPIESKAWFFYFSSAYILNQYNAGNANSLGFCVRLFRDN